MTNKDASILVVDDDRKLRDLLLEYLKKHGYATTAAKDAAEAIQAIEKLNFDLMILDVMMPGKTGIEFATELRENNNIPILMLTAMGEMEDKIRGFETGVDDYLTKPFEPKELILRIESILRRTKNTFMQSGSDSNAKHIVKFGDYEFNFRTGDLTIDKEFINLTSREQDLLAFFCKHIDKPVSREELSKKLNGISERSIDVQVTRLRKRIEPEPKNPLYLQSSWGAGYVLKSRNKPKTS